MAWLVKVDSNGCPPQGCYPIGINNILESYPLVIYPNPAHSHLSVEMKLDSYKDLQWIILDKLGREMQQGTLNGFRTRIPIDFLPDGSYFLQIIGPKGSSVQQFMKY